MTTKSLNISNVHDPFLLASAISTSESDPQINWSNRFQGHFCWFDPQRAPKSEVFALRQLTIKAFKSPICHRACDPIRKLDSVHYDFAWIVSGTLPNFINIHGELYWNGWRVDLTSTLIWGAQFKKAIKLINSEQILAELLHDLQAFFVDGWNSITAHESSLSYSWWLATNI